jgi:hypothetical protein
MHGYEKIVVIQRPKMQLCGDALESKADGGDPTNKKVVIQPIKK